MVMRQIWLSSLLVGLAVSGCSAPGVTRSATGARVNAAHAQTAVFPWPGGDMKQTSGTGRPNRDRVGRSAAAAVGWQEPAVRPWPFQRVPFPTGTRIHYDAAMSNTLMMEPDIAGAVCIVSDGRGYVSILPHGVLTAARAKTIEQEVRHFDPNLDRVFVTSEPSAYADFQDYARYLASGRVANGMLLTWRSILRKTWSIQNS